MTTLLVVGDITWRQRFAQTLKQHACEEVHTTCDAFEALNLIRRNRYDLVVFDDAVRGMEPLELGLTFRDLCHDRPIVLAATPKAEEHFRRLGPALSPHVVDSPERIERAIVQVAHGGFDRDGREPESSGGDKH